MPLDPLAGRLSTITGLRLALLTLLLGATAKLYLGGDLPLYAFSFRLVLIVIAASYVLAAAAYSIIRTQRHLREVANAQLVVDQITWTALAYVSGGPTSGATSFYALTCLVGAIVLGVRGAVTALLTGLALYAAMSAGLLTGALPPPPDQPPLAYEAGALVYPMLVNALGILAVALLAAYLADRLRITGGALAEAEVRAREAERLAELGRIAAWLAHEIRNPLGSISGSIELLREAPGLSDEDKQLCAIVRREVLRLNELVGDMLDLSKPRAPDPRRTDVARLARDVVALAQKQPDTAAAVKVTYEGPDADAFATCDEAQMRQVLWNLVRNAVQASPERSDVRVIVRDARDDRPARDLRAEPALELRVEDSGPGIDAEARERIFDAFYTTRSHGAGIGLAVVKRIVDDHAALGARIAVENLPERGAAFTVRLRATAAPAAGDASARASAIPLLPARRESEGAAVRPTARKPG